MTTLAFYLPTVIIISLVGGFLPLLRELSQRALALLLSFSAGVLLGAVFFHLLPETGKVLTEQIGWPVLTGFLLIFVMERFVFIHACEEHECDIHQMGLPAFLGISLTAFSTARAQRRSDPAAIRPRRSARRHRPQDA
jgi:zinc and cadmium transporter